MINPRRDQLAAKSAVHVAVVHNKRPAIAVDDDICAEDMLERVRDLLMKRSLTFEIERRSGAINVKIDGAGTVVIISADRLTGQPGD